MHRTFLAAAVVGLAGLASAGGPTDFISYQGQLKDAGANANGDYEFQFELWTVANTSVLADTAVLTLNVTNGLFNADLPFGDEFGAVDISGFPVEYALDIGMRPAGSMDPFTFVNRQPVRNAARATYAARGTNLFDIGDETGGTLRVLDQAGNVGFRAEPDNSGQGHFVSVAGPNGSIVLDGRSGTTGPRVTINGVGDSIFLEPGAAAIGNKVILPAGSIGSAEIGDEAGVAGNTVQYSSVTLPTTYTSIASRSIDCPADGFVVAVGTTGMGHSGSVGSNSNFLAISTDGSSPFNGVQAFSFKTGGDETRSSSMTTTQIIPVSEGVTTFSLIARCSTTSGGYHTGGASINLLYFPTSYGATSRPFVGDPGAFDPLPPLAGSPVSMPVLTEEPMPYEQMLSKQRALEAQMAELRAQMEATMRQQAEANGR